MYRTICLASLVLLATTVRANDEANWPRFRGPNGSGVSPSANPPVHIDQDSALLWKTPVPAGLSSPCIWGDRIFLTAFADGKLWTIGYDRATGKELWRAHAPAKQIEKFHAAEGSPAASTCATDGQRVVSYFGSCGLFAYDLDGKPLWNYELPTAVTAMDFGTGTSPIIAEGLVVLVRDVKEGSMAVALDAATGRERWKIDRTGSATAYSTPVVFGRGADALLVVAGSLRMRAYELATGKERWLLRGLPANTCTMAVTSDDRIYFAGWAPGADDEFKMPTYDNLLAETDANKDGTIAKAETGKHFLGQFFDNNDLDHDGFLTRAEWNWMLDELKKGENSAIAVNPKGTGDITGTNVIWKRSKGLPYVSSAILYDGRVFFVRDGGLASCYHAADGKPVYENKRVGTVDKYYASPIAAAGYIYTASLEQGKLTVLRAAADKPEVVAERALEERVSATPALVGDRLYVRSVTHLYCFGEGKK